MIQIYIKRLYENWPTSIELEKPVPGGVELDKLIEGTTNPIASRQFSSEFKHSVLPNEVRFKQSN